MQDEIGFTHPGLGDIWTRSKAVKIKVGYCKPLIKEGEECEIKDQDGTTREYQCVTGLKCTKKTSADKLKLCY
jgi:hypothetical protein